MKIEDLRIGNYVKRVGMDAEYSKVYSIENEGVDFKVGESKDGKKVYTQGYNMKGVAPIVLTEEWLMNFGGDVKPFSIGILFDRFRFIWRNEYKYWYVVDSFSQAYMTKIEFVHEFQNFIKAMNGQELTIKETV